MKSLLEAGVHFGHQTRRWNPKMRKFIFSERNGIHIIDLQQTVDRLEAACDFVRDLVSNGGTILFVGTKRQAQETMESEAKRCGMPYVTTRWLGGTLTNFSTIQGRIDYLVRTEDAKARGEMDFLPKKERLKQEEELARLNRYLGAIKLITARMADVVLEGLTAREYVQQAALEAEDVEVSAYTESGYIASPDEPYPSQVAEERDEAADAGPAAASETESGTDVPAGTAPAAAEPDKTASPAESG